MTRLSLIVAASVGLIMFAVGGIYGGGHRFGFTETPKVRCSPAIGVVDVSQYSSPYSSPYPVPDQGKAEIHLMKCGGQYVWVGEPIMPKRKTF